MRNCGVLSDETQARRLADYLLTQGIDGRVDADGEQWAIWVFDENQIDKARAEFAAFTANPNDPKYTKSEASSIRRAERQKDQEARRNLVDVRKSWRSPIVGTPVITMTIIAACVWVALTTNFGFPKDPDSEGAQRLSNLVLSEKQWLPGERPRMVEVGEGEIWRLITPIFIHYGPVHLLFNMSWVISLGIRLEGALGRWRYLLLILVVGATSNVIQYEWSAMRGILAPGFGGGYSGVVYGMVGFAWMRQTFNPAGGQLVDRNTLIIMGVWQVLCSMGAIGNVGNAAHIGGLVVGMGIGAGLHAIRRYARRWGRRGK